MLLLDNIESWIGLMVILSEDHVVVVIYPSINYRISINVNLKLKF